MACSSNASIRHKKHSLWVCCSTTSLGAAAPRHASTAMPRSIGLQNAAALPQVSFYRDNLHFSVVEKQFGKTEDGKPLPLEGLAIFIR